MFSRQRLSTYSCRDLAEKNKNIEKCTCSKKKTIITPLNTAVARKVMNAYENSWDSRKHLTLRTSLILIYEQRRRNENKQVQWKSAQSNSWKDFRKVYSMQSIVRSVARQTRPLEISKQYGEVKNESRVSRVSNSKHISEFANIDFLSNTPGKFNALIHFTSL